MAHFVRSFDCKDEKHVMWLKDVGGVMARSMDGKGSDFTRVINENPLPGKPSIDNPLDFAYIHFQLCMKYTNAVLSGCAFVPTVNQSQK